MKRHRNQLNRQPTRLSPVQKMACNFSQERKTDKDGANSGGLTLEDCDSKKQLLSASSTATSKQNGDRAGCEDEQMSEQDASERRRTGLSDLKNCSSSPSTLTKSTEELPRRNFQIPRKMKERKGCVSLYYHYCHSRNGLFAFRNPIVLQDR